MRLKSTQTVTLAKQSNKNKVDAGQFFTMEGADEVVESTVNKSAGEIIDAIYGTTEGAATTDSAVMMAGHVIVGQGDAGSFVQAVGKMAGESVSFATGANGSTGGVATLEAFDKATTANMLEEAVVVNVQAQRQEDGAEMLFPTKVLQPGVSGIKASVSIANVKTLTVGGKKIADRRLVEAWTDHTIIERVSTELRPHQTVDNADAFSSIIAASIVDVNTTGTVNTAPLKVNIAGNYRDLCDHAGAIGGRQLNELDQISAGAKIENIYLSATDGTTPEAFGISAEYLTGAKFVRASAGDSHLHRASFRAKGVSLTKAMLNVSDTATALFDGFAALVVKVRFSLTVDLNLNTGEYDSSVTSVEVDHIVNAAGDKLAPADQAYIDVVALLKTQKVAVDSIVLGAKLSDSNFAQTNTIIDTRTVTEEYVPEFGNPIAVYTPVGSDGVENAQKLNGISDGLTISRSKNALTVALNYTDALKVATENTVAGEEVQIMGIGGYIVTPYFNEVALDLDAVVKSLSSKDRAADIKETILATLRDATYQMYRDSNYGPALHSTEGPDAKPHVGFLADDTLIRYVQTDSITPEVGREFGFTAASTNDARFTPAADEHIALLTFIRPDSTQEINPLAFGSFVMFPALVQRLPNAPAGNGGTVAIDRAVDISVHVPTCPIMTRITFTNVSKAAQSAV